MLENSPVTSILTDDEGSVCGVVTPEGRIDCEFVCTATLTKPFPPFLTPFSALHTTLRVAGTVLYLVQRPLYPILSHVDGCLALNSYRMLIGACNPTCARFV